MITESTYTSKRTGLTWNVHYQELDSFDSIRNLPIGAAGAFCFCGDKFVVVYAADSRNVWEIPGGGIEEGETFEECIIREIHEESNMKVLELFPLGYETQHCITTDETYYILRYAARVEPYGPFVSDPANGEITEIKLIDPKEYKQYFDWGKRSDVLMEKAMKVLNSGNI